MNKKKQKSEGRKILHYFCLLLFAFCIQRVSAAEWTPVEIMNVKSMHDIAISPDNTSALFVVTEARLAEENAYVSQIYKTSLDGSVALFASSNGSCMQPRWSPDGLWVSFVSDRSGTRQLYLLSTQGGEARLLTKGSIPIQTYRWSPDSKTIAFVRSDEEAVVNKPIEYKKESGVNRLWLMDLSGEAKVITPKSFFVRGMGDFGLTNEEFDWSPDGKTIVFSYAPGSGFEHSHLHASLASIDLTSGVITPWLKENGYEALPKFSPDGQWVAYLTSDGKATYLYDRYVAIRSCKGDQYKKLAATFNEGSFIAGPNLLGWKGDGEHVLFFEPKATKFHLCSIPINGGAPVELPISDRYFDAPALSADGTMLGLVIQDPTSPPEVYMTSIKNGYPKQLTQFNERFLSFPKPKIEKIHWKSKDGKEIEGLLTYPIGYEEEKRYPLLVEIHGGPMGFFAESFMGSAWAYPIASFAEAGFLILRPNVRGSTGYGKEFRAANKKDFGGGDFQDIMSGVDFLIERGIVDSDRMGIMGWSYGGYMSAWAITQTNRFKAASIGAGIFHLLSMAGTSDIAHFTSDYLGDWKDSTLYFDRSPLYFVENVQTPCLIQHGISDQRVPISQAYEFYRALEQAGKNTIFMIYPMQATIMKSPKWNCRGWKRIWGGLRNICYHYE